jgi:hypothetical protein
MRNREKRKMQGRWKEDDRKERVRKEVKRGERS